MKRVTLLLASCFMAMASMAQPVTVYWDMAQTQKKSEVGMKDGMQHGEG